MRTQCKTERLELQGFDRRKLVLENSGTVNSSDAGLLLLGKIEQHHAIIRRLVSCFIDHREISLVKHSLESLLTQRIFGLVQGYEDLVDHDSLGEDPLFQYVCGTPNQRLAGKSTLNRLELGMEAHDSKERRYIPISWNVEKIEELLCEIFLESFNDAPDELILDFDATDLPIYGEQEQRFYHGYYRKHCYLPLYVFCNGFPLIARLRPSYDEACEGTEKILESLVDRIRSRFPKAKIIFRADGGFCREDIMKLAEELKIGYIVGFSGNSRLYDITAAHLQEAKAIYNAKSDKGKPGRVFQSFQYKTHDSWSIDRRVIAKLEFSSRGSNSRFIVTNLDEQSQALYEEVYCGRGDMENRIKEQKNELFSMRVSTHWTSSNQLRLLFSAFAHVYYLILQRALNVTEDPKRKNMPGTLRLKFMKVAATVKITTRRIWVKLPESFPYWDIWRRLILELA